MIILDTDILTLIEWEERTGTQKLRAKFAQFGPGEIRASIISVDEQFRGWMAYIAKAASIAKEIEAYRRLHRQLRLYGGLLIMDFDEIAATHFQSLRKQFRRHKENDLKIAAIALAHQALVVTRNLRDFEQIPGLRSEDWTKQ